MKGIRGVRRQHVEAANQLSARPTIRQVFSSQSQMLSPAEILAREVQSIPPAQAPDGKFIFLAGYSRVGDGDVFG